MMLLVFESLSRKLILLYCLQLMIIISLFVIFSIYYALHAETKLTVEIQLNILT
jgi:hypothetical protein